MNSTERRLQIYLMMQNKKNLRIKDLASEYEVDKRTIYRDLRYLRDLNVPITHDPEYGYGIMRDAHIKPLMFTHRELATIMMGLSFLKSQHDEVIIDDALKVQNKIHSVIPGELKEFMSAIDKKVIVAPYQRKISEKKKGGNWFTVLSAISNNKPVEFVYTDRANKKSDRTSDPLLIVYFTDHWNLIGYCHQKKDYRNFILDRMNSVQVSDKSILHSGSATLNELLYERQASETVIEVSVANDKTTHFKTHLPAEIDSENAQKDSTIISFRFNDLTYIDNWLLTYNDSVKILFPSSLKDIRRDTIAKLSQSI